MSESTNPTYVVPSGYVLRWERPTYDLLKKTDETVEGAAWITACKKHGTVHDAATQGAAEALGRKADRITWCDGCRTDAASQPPKPAATPTRPGTIKVTVPLVIEVEVSRWAGDDDAKVSALVESIKAQTGADDEKAAEPADLLLSKVKDPAEIKTEVADWVLAQVQGLERITETGALVTIK